MSRRVDQRAAQIGREVELALHREAESWPNATGYTSEKIHHRVAYVGPNRRRITLRSESKHGDWREKGTRPHVIPRGGAAAQMAKGYPLRFYWPKVGRVVRFWKVNHPGNKPMPWFRKTIVATLRRLR